jgi:hypothetical protein
MKTGAARRNAKIYSVADQSEDVLARDRPVHTTIGAIAAIVAQNKILIRPALHKFNILPR